MHMHARGSLQPYMLTVLTVWVGAGCRRSCVILR